MAFGETWYENGQTPTELRYTGQRSFEELGLYFYQSRFYDAMLGRFVQADSIIPESGSPLAWDRFSYINNNPIIATDPSGHKECDLECQQRSEYVDPIRIHEGEYYSGNCYGAQECIPVKVQQTLTNIARDADALAVALNYADIVGFYISGAMAPELAIGLDPFWAM